MPRAATGHYGTGDELPGGWRIVPELAAGGLWSSATDLANLLIALVRAYRGEPDALLTRAMAHAMMTRQNGGPYGLGGAVDGSGGSDAGPAGIVVREIGEAGGTAVPSGADISWLSPAKRRRAGR